jgi:SAM-dependent methyltransferase
MERFVEPELLDALPPADPRAAWSRNDLVRVNACMGHCGIMARVLHSACPGQPPRRIVDLGSGDGRFLLRVARRLSTAWQGTSAVLLDRWKIVSPETEQRFEALGWRPQVVQADALDWLSRPTAPACDAMVANLFLHHFDDGQLAGLLGAVARHAHVFIAAEPRRSERSLLFSRLLWLLGCNHVTRHDAALSIRAGFKSSELSRLWPDGGAWVLHDQPVGWCSHLFIAQRRE